MISDSANVYAWYRFGLVGTDTDTALSKWPPL